MHKRVKYIPRIIFIIEISLQSKLKYTNLKVMHMGKLTGKVAIVTGSTSGMGRDTAYVLAGEGAKVVVVGRREDRAKEVVEKIKADGGEAIYVVADMTNDEDVANIVDKTVEEFGTVDILFNNAGVITFKDTQAIDKEEWNRVFQVNVYAPLLLAQKVAPIMKEKGEGYIINTSSVAGTAARWGVSAYTASKHAMNGLTRALARDLGPEIRVNAILPGAIQTEMLDSAGGADAVEPMRLMSPLQRLGTGNDIGNVVLFLVTEQSAFLTGQLIRVDGGIDC